MDWRILLLILVILIAVVGYYINAESIPQISVPILSSVSGSFDPLPITNDIIKLIDPYLRETGQIQLTQWLHQVWSYTPTEQRIIKRSAPKQYLYALIEDIAIKQNIKNPIDFITKSAISYKSFVKPALKSIIIDTVHEYSTSDCETISRLVRQHSPTLTKSQIDDIVSIVKVIRIYKISSTVKTLPKRTMPYMFEPDTIALMPIVTQIANIIPSDRVLEDLKQRIITLNLLRDYPNVHLNKIYTLADLLEYMRNLKPQTGYLEGRRDATIDAQHTVNKLQQDLTQAKQAEQLRLNKRLKAEQHIQDQNEVDLQTDFYKVIKENPDLQQYIDENPGSANELFESYKQEIGDSVIGASDTDLHQGIKEFLQRKIDERKLKSDIVKT